MTISLPVIVASRRQVRPAAQAEAGDIVLAHAQGAIGAGAEEARAPERRADGKAPLGGCESRFELTHLEDANRRVHAVRHNREARVSTGLAFGKPEGSMAPVKASYVPMYAHLALVLAVLQMVFGWGSSGGGGSGDRGTD